jgi:two-component sensor histidine kinase
LSAIVLLQGFLVFSGIYRSLIYVSDKLERAVPREFWWATLDLRASAWLLITPLLAAIVVDRRSPVWQIGLLHAGLLLLAVFVSGNYLHRFAHIQSDQLKHLLDTAEVLPEGEPEQNAAVADRSKSTSGAATEEFGNKSYEGVNFHNSYGLQYWTGEFTLVLASYFMMSAIGYAVLYFRLTEYRTRQAEQLSRTMVQLQHDLLCNRLRPHFLFNTLNTISSLTLTDGTAARACISQLGELLRESIESLPEGEIRLDREIELVQIYLQIQKTRFGEKLEYSINVDESLRGAMVPAFVLQPLVENSFQHGFQDCTNTACVSVSATRDGDICRLEVSDNGATIDLSRPLDERHGLSLTRQRLKLQYDQHATLTYEPNQPSGLRVIVSVPLHLQNGDLA